MVDESLQPVRPPRRVLLEDGDILIVHRARAAPDTGSPTYELRIRGYGPLGEQFARSEHALGRADQLARERRSRVVYVDGPDVDPDVLINYR